MGNWSNEVEPLQDFKNLLDENWVEYSDIPKPYLLIVNDVDEAISRINLNESDYLLISVGSGEQYRMRGNWTYYDKIFEIVFNVLTKENRQRLRNINKEIRSICLINKHSFPNWQLIRPIRYREYANTGDINIWRGEITVNLENAGIKAEETV